MLNKLNLLSVRSVRETSVRLSRPACAQGFNDIFNTMMSFGGWVAGRLAWPPTPAANASLRLKRSFRSSRSSCSLGTALLTGMLGFALLLVGCGGGGGGGGGGSGGGGPAPVSTVEFVAGNTDTSIVVAWKNPNQPDINRFNVFWENTADPNDGDAQVFTAADVNVSAEARVIVTIEDLTDNANYTLTIMVIYENSRSASFSPPGPARTGSARINPDGDIDGDGVLDATDAFRADACAGTDTDEDGIPDTLVAGCDTDLTADLDDDNDGVPDATDAFETDACASTDTDNDDKPDSLVPGCTTSPLTEDMDDDNNGLIEIRTLDQLALLRDDLDGDGEDDNVFPGITPVGSAGCPDGGCLGYELARSLNFSQEASYEENSDKQSTWTDREGSGWVPIGSCTANDVCTSYTAMFDGRGYAIADLFIAASNSANGVGLFGALSGKGTIQNLHLRDVNVRGGANDVGLLVGKAFAGLFADLTIAGGMIMSPSARAVGGLIGDGDDVDSSLVSVNIRGVSVSDVTIRGFITVGGLVGLGRDNNIYAVSVSGVTLLSDSAVGGAVGSATDAELRHVYIVGGSVSGGISTGGLVGVGHRTKVSYSYVANGPIVGHISPDAPVTGGLVGNPSNIMVTDSYWDNQTTGQLGISGFTVDGTPLATAQLQNPTTFTGIYADWGNFWCDPDSLEIQENRTDPGGSFERLWDLGDANQYPVLNCLPVSVEEQQQRQ